MGFALNHAKHTLLYHWCYIRIPCIPLRLTDKERVATSIKVDPDLWKEVRIQAIREDLEVSELVERALRRDLERVKSR